MDFLNARTVSTSLLAAVIGVSGCATTEEVQEEPTVERPAEPARPPVRDSAMGEFGQVALALPTGERSTSALLVEAAGPDSMRVGQRYDYRIRVSNLTDTVLHDVRVLARPEGSLQIGGSEPQAQPTPDGQMMWWFPELEPGGSRVIAVGASPQGTGLARMCLTADYSAYACLAVEVEQPMLEIQAQGPNQALVCEELEYTVAVRNTGTGTADGVTIVEDLPPGLTTIDGQQTIRIEVGDLAAGETREYSVAVQPQSVGQYQFTPEAMGEGGLSGQAQGVTTAILQPTLAVSKAGPEQDYIGVPIQYQITVQNTGNVPAPDTIVTEQLPAGQVTFGQASDGGVFQDGVIRWNLGTLEPGATRTVSYTVTGARPGAFQHTTRAEAYCAEAVLAQGMTDVRGIPALVLEVVDEQDPVRVGSDTVYLIQVGNQGSLTAEGIVISAQLEESMEFVDASGPTPFAVEGNTVRFEPYAGLAPGQVAEYRVVVRARSAVDARMFVEMTSNLLQRPVRETESTNFYE